MEELGEKSSSDNLEQGVIDARSPSGSRGGIVVRTSAEDETELEKEQLQLEESEEGEGVDAYDTTDFISLPSYSLESTFEHDPLELEYSYGYNCTIPNLCVVDSDTLLWYTGNIIHIFNAKQRRLAFRRSALGQDISFIAKSKSTDEFAVAENGGEKVSPMIIVYRWPDFKVCSVLRGGATTYYKSVDFSSDGSKLVSQAGPPGDTLTIWDITQKTAIMSFRNPDDTVSKAVFSSFDPDVFVTFGTGHIKFWRLIETFTGLKIESLPGRFGEVENNDVSALCFLPEGRVMSNFCGGNLAIWKPGASLELSFSMKNLEPCHSDLITFIQLYLEDNHMYTSSLDGKVRVWNYSYITSFYNDEQGDFRHVDIEPSYERKIEDKKGNFGTPIMMLPKDDQEFPYHFYTQDVKGGIWLLDLELKKNPDPWTQLYSCHAGPINDMSPSPGDYFLATVGSGGRMNVYSHSEKSMVMSKQFEEDGVSLLWLPFKVDPTGSTIVIGFCSGILRVIVAMVKSTNGPTAQVSVVQAMKPHSSAITVLTINSAGNLLISGSEDKSIFLYSFYAGDEKVKAIPLGMVKVPGAVTDISWDQYKTSRDRFLVSCDNGRVAQIILDKRNKEIIAKASRNIDTYVLDLTQKITEAIVRGKAPRQYFSKYMGNNLIWIEEKSSVHSYHNHLYNVGGPPAAKLNISGGHTVQCTLELQKGKYMAFGLNNGVIKIIKKNEESHIFSDSWQIVMHNSRNCTIKKLCLSYDQKILYSCGTDSGIFAYKVNLDGDDINEHKTLPLLSELPRSVKECEVLNLSLEEERIKKKTERQQEKHRKEVEKFKEKVIAFLTSYYQMVEVNNALPKCLRIPKTFFRLQTQDEREAEKSKILSNEESILAPLRERKEKLFKKVQTIKKHFIDPIKTQKFYVFAIRKPNYLKSFPERRLFSKDPLEEDRDLADIEQEKRWEKLFGKKNTDKNKQQPTEFERMMKKVVTALGKEREMEVYYEHCRDGNRNEGHELDPQNEEVPDLITAAGAFLSEYNKFTQAEKTTFQRINTNRLKRLKCKKEIERVDKLKTGFQNYYDRVVALFENLIKSETKEKEKAPPIMEKLHHLLNIRQLIYLHKETFNKALRELRRQKTAIINYYYWAQEEYKYMVQDLKQYWLDLDGIELPKPLEVVWDLEYPDHLKFKPGPMPKDTALRMELYRKNLETILKLIPIDVLKKEIRKEGVKNHRLFQLLIYRKESFCDSIITIRETMENMITEFDRKFMPLLLQRSKASVEINFLKAEYSSTLQEVDILYRYELLQTSASRLKFETIKMKHVYILRENVRKRKVGRYNDQMKECHKTIEDLNAKFQELVRDEKWAKHLARTYKRKYKSPKKSCDSTASIVSSESSSDDDDYDDDDDDDDAMDDDRDDYEEMGAGVAYIYDETILPPGCDEDRFKLTFKLRNQRHVEENRISEIKKEKEIIVEEVKAIKKVIKICDALLALFYAGTFRFLKMMRDDMNDVNYLITLHPSQVQIFDVNDPLKNVPPLEECKLIEQDDYLLKTDTLRNLKEAIDGVSGVVEKTQKSTKQQVKELKKLAEKNSKRYHEIEALLASKFGESINVDKGQTYVLMSMIKRAIRRATKELVEKEKIEKKEAAKTDKLKHKEDLVKTKKERLRTLHTLYTIEAENNRIMADKLASEKRSTWSRMDLTKERDDLKKRLAEVEEQEIKLVAALKEV